MATPSRLVQLHCPGCNAQFWVIDSDWRGGGIYGAKELTYPQREYTCTSCSRSGSGHTVITQGPPEFLLQPHEGCPMTATDFEHWVGVLREHFPDHPKLREVGRTFFPALPGPPSLTVEMWEEEPGKSPRCTLDPSADQVADWLARLGPNAHLTLEYKHGLKLTVTRSGSRTFDASCADWRTVIAAGTRLPEDRVRTAIGHFLSGDGDGCLWAIAPVTPPGSDA